MLKKTNRGFSSTVGIQQGLVMAGTDTSNAISVLQKLVKPGRGPASEVSIPH